MITGSDIEILNPTMSGQETMNVYDNNDDYTNVILIAPNPTISGAKFINF